MHPFVRSFVRPSVRPFVRSSIVHRRCTFQDVCHCSFFRPFVRSSIVLRRFIFQDEYYYFSCPFVCRSVRPSFVGSFFKMNVTVPFLLSARSSVRPSLRSSIVLRRFIFFQINVIVPFVRSSVGLFKSILSRFRDSCIRQLIHINKIIRCSSFICQLCPKKI